MYLRWDCTYTCLLVRASENTALEFYVLLKITMANVFYISDFFGTVVGPCGTMYLQLQLLGYLGVVVNICNLQFFSHQILG
jgi:hypothetical protein